MGKFLVCLFTGMFGGHKFFIEKKPKIGIIYFFTLGGFYIAWIYDCVRYYKDYKNLTINSHQDITNIHNPPIHGISPQPEIKHYDLMDGYQFELFCAELLKNNGFINVTVTQKSNDHGIDILAEKDTITYAIQCKRYSSKIGNAAIQQAYSGKGFYHQDVAAVLTNQYFTEQAKIEAQAIGVKLWDRDKLDELIKNKDGYQ